MPLGNLQIGSVFKNVGVNETVLAESERILKLLLDTRQVPYFFQNATRLTFPPPSTALLFLI